MNRTLTLTLASTFVAAACTTVFAAPITQPGDLAPGDSYRLVFVTSTTRDATSSDIGDYNSFVAGVAAGESGLAALGTTWKAIGSTASVDARDNTDSNPAVDGTGVPIYRLDGTRIANNYADLWDSSLIAPVATFEDGMATATFSNRVWTGTIPSGSVNPSFPLGATEDVIYGNPLSSFGGWTTTTIAEDPSVPYHMYAMSGVMTVVPEPSSLLLAMFAMTAFCIVAVRRSHLSSPISIRRWTLGVACRYSSSRARRLLRRKTRLSRSRLPFLAIVLMTSVCNVANADIVTFESGYSEPDAVTSIVTATNEIAVSTDTGPGAYAVQTGTATYAFGSVYGPDSVRPDLVSLVGSYFLTDENIGSPSITAAFLFVFDQPISNLSLAVLDLEGTATLTVFSDAAMTTSVGTHTLSNFEDGDVDILSVLTPSADILSARLSTNDFGIGVDNITFETVPEPSSFFLGTLGAVALCIALLRGRCVPRQSA